MNNTKEKNVTRIHILKIVIVIHLASISHIDGIQVLSNYFAVENSAETRSVLEWLCGAFAHVCLVGSKIA